MDAGQTQGALTPEAEAVLKDMVLTLGHVHGARLIGELQQGATLLGQAITFTIDVEPNSDNVDLALKVHKVKADG